MKCQELKYETELLYVNCKAYRLVKTGEDRYVLYDEDDNYIMSGTRKGCISRLQPTED